MTPREIAILATTGPLPDGLIVSALVVREAMAAIVAIAPLKTIMAEAQGQKGDTPANRQVNAVEAPIRAIGAKLAPGMSPAQGAAWLDGIMLSMGKYPTKTVMQAARRAAEERFQYGIGSVDNRLHELCEEIEVSNGRARYRLEKFLKQIERASQPKIEQQEVEPMAVEYLADLPDALWSLGVKLGYIAGDDMAEAELLRAKKFINAIDGDEIDAHTLPTEGNTVGEALNGTSLHRQDG